MIQHKIWQEFDNFRRELENVMQGWDDVGANGLPFAQWARELSYPHIRVYQDEDAVKVEAAIPGVEPVSLALSIEDNTLILSGNKLRWAEAQKTEASGDGDDEAGYRKARPEGSFKRSIALPVKVDADQTTAEYVHGVLRITMPKAEAAKARKIEVTFG
jgi:HSP20 family protein